MKTPKLYVVVPLWVGTEYTHKGGLKYICPGHEVIIKETKSNLGAFLIGTTTVVLVMTCCWWWISRHGIDLIALLYISLSTSRINPHGISIIHQWSTCPHNKNNSPMNSRLAAFHEHFHWKTESCHSADFVVTGGAGYCRYENMRFHQWSRSWHSFNTSIFAIHILLFNW